MTSKYRVKSFGLIMENCRPVFFPASLRFAFKVTQWLLSIFQLMMQRSVMQTFDQNQEEAKLMQQVHMASWPFAFVGVGPMTKLRSPQASYCGPQRMHYTG